jgi:UDP-glucose 4-epimerase
MKKVLITGGLGFIGSNLAEYCVKLGYDVTLISRSDSKINNIKEIKDKIKLIICDVKDINLEVKGMDYIFHLAGTADNHRMMDNSYIDLELNCTATIALLEACKKHNPHVRIIFASTINVNGNPGQIPVDQNSHCNPQGLYGATRLCGEHICQVYNKIFNMNCVIARFSNAFGAKEQTNNKKKAGFNYLISMALRNEEITLYDNGNFLRDYIYVSDVVSACLTLAEKGETSKIYYVGRGEYIKFKELIDIVIEEAKGGKIKSVEPPEFHKKVGVVNFVCDISELTRLGWKPNVSLREGIKKTIEYHKNAN